MADVVQGMRPKVPKMPRKKKKKAKKAKKKTGTRWRDCAECGEYKFIQGDNRCRACYFVAGAPKPGSKKRKKKVVKPKPDPVVEDDEPEDEPIEDQPEEADDMIEEDVADETEEEEEYAHPFDFVSEHMQNEIEAMKLMAAALEPLKPERRRRVFKWAKEVFLPDTTPVLALPLHSAAADEPERFDGAFKDEEPEEEDVSEGRPVAEGLTFSR